MQKEPAKEAGLSLSFWVTERARRRRRGGTKEEEKDSDAHRMHSRLLSSSSPWSLLASSENSFQILFLKWSTGSVGERPCQYSTCESGGSASMLKLSMLLSEFSRSCSSSWPPLAGLNHRVWSYAYFLPWRTQCREESRTPTVR